MHLLTAGHELNSKQQKINICLKIRLLAGFEPSTLSVQKKSFLTLYPLHHRCVASVDGKPKLLN